MRNIDKPPRIPLPFANDGNKNIIPNAPTGTRNASYTEGFPTITEEKESLGGLPPSRLDFNAIGYVSTKAIQWINAGGLFEYDSAFATHPQVGGYPKGARVLRSDGSGVWVSLIDNNLENPESGSLNWRPDGSVDSAIIEVPGSDVTLSPLQYAREVLMFTGSISADYVVTLPSMPRFSVVIVNTGGNGTLTLKTRTGSGVKLGSGSRQMVYCDGVNTFSLTGGITQPKFTNDTTLATTAFVQQAQGSYGAANLVTNTAALDLLPVWSGQLFKIQALTVGCDVKLPLLNSVPSGSTYIVACNDDAGGEVNLMPKIGETILVLGSTPLTSFRVLKGFIATVVRSGSGWELLSVISINNGNPMFTSDKPIIVTDGAVLSFGVYGRIVEYIDPSKPVGGVVTLPSDQHAGRAITFCANEFAFTIKSEVVAVDQGRIFANGGITKNFIIPKGAQVTLIHNGQDWRCTSSSGFSLGVGQSFNSTLLNDGVKYYNTTGRIITVCLYVALRGIDSDFGTVMVDDKVTVSIKQSGSVGINFSGECVIPAGSNYSASYEAAIIETKRLM